MEKEIPKNDIEQAEMPEAEVTEAIEDVTPEKVEESPSEGEWTAITKSTQVEKKTQENIVPEPEIMPEAMEEPEIKVISEDKIKPVEEVNEDTLGRSTELMAAEAKRARKAAKKEAKQNTPDYEDNGSVFTSKGFRDTWNTICFILLVLAIGLPVGLLAYIIINFFL